MSAQVLTANRLVDGAVVFLAGDGSWGTLLSGVRIAADTDTAAALEAIAGRDVVARIVVGPYLIEVAAQDGKVVPTRYRERIRAFGPSTHPELAKPAYAS